jgi:EpsD family peptidyl-prolyl cis-trans isomerase
MNKTSMAALVGTCALAVGAGTQHPDTEAGSGAVIARVGDQVVTTSELDAEFRAAHVSPDAQKDPALIKRMVNELVVRKYLVQQALQSKLDSDAGVRADLLQAREQLLATTYLNRTLDSKPATMGDIQNYIRANTAKFNDRVLMAVDQIVFSGADMTAVVNANKAAKTLEDVDKNLTALGITHRRAVATVSVGELKPDLAAALRAHKDGLLLVRQGDSGTYAKLIDEQPMPFSGKAADDRAREELKAEAMKGEIATATVAANKEVKYEGAYASMLRAASSAPTSSAPPPGAKAN